MSNALPTLDEPGRSKAPNTIHCHFNDERTELEEAVGFYIVPI